MTKALNTCLANLEARAGDTLPLYARRWLGHILTDAERAQADAEWTAMQPVPPLTREETPPHLWDWLGFREVRHGD